MDKKKHFNFSKKQKITIFSLLAILILIASVVGFLFLDFTTTPTKEIRILLKLIL